MKSDNNAPGGDGPNEVEALRRRISDLETENSRILESMRFITESEQTHKTLFDTASVGIVVVGVTDKSIQYANHALCGMLGYTPEELTKMNISDIHPKDKLDYVISVFESMVKRKLTFGENLPCRRKDGTVFYADINTAIVEYGGKKCGIGFVTDVTESKKIEQTLRESEEREKLAIKGGDLGTWNWDIVTDEVINNERWAEMAGYRLEELKKSVENWGLLTHPDDIPRVNKAIKEHLEGRSESYEIEHRMRHKSGKWIWVLDKGRVIKRDANGKPLRMAGTHLDITDRKEAENKLRESEHLHKMIAQMTTDYFFKLDVDEKGGVAMNFVTEAMRETTGRTLDEVRTPDLWKNIFHHEDAGKAIVFLRSVVLSGESGDIDVRTFHKEGHARWVRVTAKPEWDAAANRVVAIWGSVRDITAYKQAEEAAQEKKAAEESEEVLRAAFENANDAMFWADADTGIIINCNLSAERMIERDRAEIIGKHHSTLHPKADESRYTDMFKNHAVNKGAVNSEAEVVTKSGKRIPAHIASAIICINGRIVNQGIFRDLTDLKRAQSEKETLARQINQYQKMEAVGQLAGGIAHDFNNILAVIIGTASLALRRLPAEDPTVSHIKRILKVTNRAKDLTMKMLTFARREQLNIRRIPANRLLEELLEMLDRSIPLNINVIKKPDTENIYVNVDQNQLLQALLNLCINSRDAMPDGGTLRIEIESAELNEDACRARPGMATGRYCAITVADTGAGVPPEIINRVFEPFFTTKERGKGTGLGLSVTHGIIQGHNGHIEIENREGGGTAVRIYLPAYGPDEITAEENEAGLQSGGSKGTLLIVDDDNDYLEIVAHQAADEGYKAICADNGVDALRAYHKLRRVIDVALLDVIMPGMDGQAVFAELKSLNPDVKIILCSGFSADGAVSQMLAQGALGFIQKPYDSKDLFRLVSKVIGS
ncbi:MAG: PAS domain S-box protein [bacterium]